MEEEKYKGVVNLLVTQKYTKSIWFIETEP